MIRCIIYGVLCIFSNFLISNFPVCTSTTGSVNRPGPVPAFLRSPSVIPPPPLDMKPFLQFPLESPHPATIGLFHNFNTVSAHGQACIQACTHMCAHKQCLGFVIVLFDLMEDRVGIQLWFWCVAS